MIKIDGWFGSGSYFPTTITLDINKIVAMANLNSEERGAITVVYLDGNDYHFYIRNEDREKIEKMLNTKTMETE